MPDGRTSDRPSQRLGGNPGRPARSGPYQAAGDQPLVYGGARGGVSGQASVAAALAGVLTRFGLASEADVGVSSLRNRAGLIAYQRRYRIEDAAFALGARSLDTAAALIGLHWQERR